MLLHDAATRDEVIFGNAPVAMFFPVLDAFGHSQKHTDIVHMDGLLPQGGLHYTHFWKSRYWQANTYGLGCPENSKNSRSVVNVGLATACLNLLCRQALEIQARRSGFRPNRSQLPLYCERSALVHRRTVTRRPIKPEVVRDLLSRVKEVKLRVVGVIWVGQGLMVLIRLPEPKIRQECQRHGPLARLRVIGLT